ncbi:MAG: acyltransferase [Granulosicoccus sp.]
MESTIRQRIAMARMFCVLGMIYVHVPNGQQGEAVVYGMGNGQLAGFLESFLVEGPGRAGAALLSVISGYLAATALLRPGSSIKALYSRRFVSIVLPMTFWAVATYLVYLLVSQSRSTFLDDANTLMDHLNTILFLTHMPDGPTMHLGFLRDLFVCVLLSPLLLAVIQRAGWTLLLVLGLFYLLEHNQASIIILRPLVVFAFAIGVFMACRHTKLTALDPYWPIFIALAAMSTVIIMMVNEGVAPGVENTFMQAGLQFNETVLYPIGRLFGSLAIWTVIPLMLGGRIENWVSRFSPYLFAAFCSHYLMLTLIFFGGWMPVFGDRQSEFFIVWFLFAPLLSMLVAFCIVQITLKVAPPLATLITGGRIKVPSNAADSQSQRRRQGFALGVALSLMHTWDAVLRFSRVLSQEWLEASRRLLLGRR